MAKWGSRAQTSGVTTKLNSTIVKTLLAFALLVVASCASSQPRVNNVQVVNQQLQGAWILQSYRPFTALETPLAVLVNMQFGQMRVTINGTQISAQGPGVQVARSYQVLEADAQSATLTVSEPTGASVRVWIAIQDNVLTFHPLDAPWGGEGTLRRM